MVQIIEDQAIREYELPQPIGLAYERFTLAMSNITKAPPPAFVLFEGEFSYVDNFLRQNGHAKLESLGGNEMEKGRYCQALRTSLGSRR